jgi:hypothetical protein
MSSTSAEKRVGAEKDEEEDLPTSQLTRPSPDAILADEADETNMLGNESDSEDGGSSVRNSTGSALEDMLSSSKQSGRAGAASVDSTYGTPRQRDFPLDRSPVNLAAPIAIKSTHNDLESQVQVADLVNQVTGLNTKLVNSFMRISDLEDDLSATQEKLTGFQITVASLEKERQEHLAALNTGLLVEKAHVSSEMQKMMERVIEETAERGKAISDKEKIESELDELSSSLFSEANKMVAVERLSRARAEEKSKSMEERLRNTEELMEQQQKRLAELQGIVEKAEKERSVPQTNGDNQRDTSGSQLEAPRKTASASVLPFGEEQVKLDFAPYTELRAFLNHLRKLRVQLAPFYNYPLSGAAGGSTTLALASPNGSRTNSPAPGQGRVVSGTGPHSGLPSPLNQGGTTMLSPFITAGVSRHKDFPSLPANVEQMIHLPSQVSSLSFLKRMNEEDCEPCLRLDFAPGLNWLSRRQMQTAILEGNLLIEPVFGGGQYDEGEVRNRALGSPPAACAMCGKSVVNVPMPGGTSTESTTWISAAGNAALGAVASSLPGRDQTTSPPIGSGSFFTSSNNSTSQPPSLTSKKSSSGLFSTLRSMGSSPRPSLSPNLSSSNFSSFQQQNEAPSLGVEEDQFATRLSPIPTHIFRVSETNQTRYLLCPDYCLRRLRVTCDFWGYIRHLERAVVLEGKLAWDNEEPGKIVDVETKTLPPSQPEKEAGEVEATKVILEQTGSDRLKEGEHATSDQSADKNVEGIAPEKVEPLDEGEKVDDGDEEKTEGAHVDPLTDDEDGFADAQSGVSTPMHEKISFEGEGEKEEEPANEQVALVTEKEKPEVHIPPLPPRHSRAVTPLPPPTLPPRRSPHGRVKAAKDVAAEPRRFLPTNSGSNLTWEEKVWLEVLRHKADMWSARVGVEKAEA